MQTPELVLIGFVRFLCPNLLPVGSCKSSCVLMGMFLLLRFLVGRFFAAPEDSIQKQRQMKLLTRIYEEAYTVHLWNSLTSNLVPEINSLVEIILSRSCLRCKDAV